MNVNFKNKTQVVSSLSKIIESAMSAIVASLEGITVNEITDLRCICRKNNIYVCVVRNTLMRRALNNSIFKGLQSLFVGSNIVAFSTVEISDCARIFVKFAKTNPKFKIKGAIFNGVFFDESNIVSLSSLPNYKDCILNLLYVIKNVSIGRLVMALRLLSSYREHNND